MMLMRRGRATASGIAEWLRSESVLELLAVSCAEIRVNQRLWPNGDGRGLSYME